MNFNASISRHMIGILSAVINKKPVYILPEKLDWNHLYYLAVLHKVANTVNYRIIGANIKIPKDVQANFTWSFQNAVFLEHQQSMAMERILPALEQAGIEAMAMRGAVVKGFYPQKDMRITECLEFLVEPQKEFQIFKIMTELGFSREFFLGTKAMVYRHDKAGEVRFYQSMESSSRKMQKYLSSLWKRTVPAEQGSSIRVMGWEDFYLYMICDMANRFALRELDVRDIMDLWVFEKKFTDRLNRTYLNMELKNMELFLFERYLHHLSCMWFADGHKDSTSDEDADISNSLCLDFEQMVLTKGEEAFASCKPVLPMVDEIELWNQKEQRKEVRRRFWRWVFPSRHYMRASYPVLDKLPGFLLPIFWLIRLLGLLLGRLTLPLRRRLAIAFGPMLNRIHAKFPGRAPEEDSATQPSPSDGEIPTDGSRQAPSPAGQNPAAREEPSPDETEPMAKEEPIPDRMEPMAKEEPIPDRTEPMAKEEPIPDRTEPMAKEELSPADEKTIIKEELAVEEKFPTDNFESRQ